MHTTLPVTMPVAAPFEAREASLPLSYPVVSRTGFEPAMPGRGAPMLTPMAAPAVAYGDPAVAQSWRPPGPGWSEPTQLVRPRNRERFVGTLRMRHSDLRIVVGKLVLPMVLLVIVGIGIGAYVVFSGDDVKLSNGAVATSAADPEPAKSGASVPAIPTAEPSPSAQDPEPASAAAANPAAIAADPAVNVEPVAAKIEPAPAVKVEPVAAKIEPVPAVKVEPVAARIEPAPAAKVEPPATLQSPPSNLGAGEPAVPTDTAAKTAVLVDVRIDSRPSGATVTLVDRGKTQYVGNTPVNATVDASREYDLVFTYPNKPTQVEHLNAKATHRIAVTLGATASATKAPKPIDSAPRHVEKPSAEPAPAPVKKASVEPVLVKKPARAAEPLGEGMLMISSKPPCEIIIDGKSTGLTTPQRAIPLPVGSHKVTLVNNEKDIKKTVSVQITANTTEKIIEDLMQ